MKDTYDGAVKKSIDKINSIVTFDKNEVYILIAIARSKNNPEISYAASDYHKGPAIFRAILRKDNVDSIVKRMIGQISTFSHEPIRPKDFNLYLTFNPRNTRKAFRTLNVYFNEWVFNEDWERLKYLESKWYSALQKKSARSRKEYYLIDIDNIRDVDEAKKIYFEISKKSSYDILEFNSRNGYHILAEPFNVQKFKKLTQHLDVEVKTDDCVNIYCGNWLE